jgi:hypothetical protein
MTMPRKTSTAVPGRPASQLRAMMISEFGQCTDLDPPSSIVFRAARPSAAARPGSLSGDDVMMSLTSHGSVIMMR